MRAFHRITFLSLINVFKATAIAFANGTLRQIGYAPIVSDLTAHQISSFTLIFFFFVYFRFISRKWRIESAQNAWLIGLMWFLLTIGFEFGFVHFISGNPWNKLLHDYNLSEGRLWALVLVSILVEPYIIHRLQKSNLKNLSNK